MCVIVLIETVRPSENQIENMWDANSKGGGGAAWREAGFVKWKKGLDKKEMLSLNRTLPLPYVLHFRQPSNDTSDSLLACHPFQIDEDATSGFEGTFDGYVLFHNGYWGEWRRKMEALSLASGGKIKGPSGAWSDSRALALSAHHMGLMFLEFVNERVLCLGPGELDIEMFGGPWLAVKGPDSEETFVVSNRTWEKGYTVTDHRKQAQESTSKLLGAAQAAVTGNTSGESGGTSQGRTFPATHERTTPAAGSQGDQQEQVQKGSQGAIHGDVARGAQRGTGTLEGQKQSCTGCGKQTAAGTIILEQWFCYQCWAKHDSRDQEPVNEALWIGTCERCRVGSSGMKTLLGDQWLCHACWQTNGKPKIYYARERGTARAS